MEIVETKTELCNYPVGENMHTNIPIIKDMTDAISGIKEFKNCSFNIICRGSSGAIIAAIMCTRIPTPCNIVHVKKPNEESHDSGLKLLPNRKNIIVDDFIGTGETMNAIYDKVTEWSRIWNTRLKIDAVCISGIYKTSLKFEPKYFICSSK